MSAQTSLISRGVYPVEFRPCLIIILNLALYQSLEGQDHVCSPSWFLCVACLGAEKGPAGILGYILVVLSVLGRLFLL